MPAFKQFGIVNNQIGADQRVSRVFSMQEHFFALDLLAKKRAKVYLWNAFGWDASYTPLIDESQEHEVKAINAILDKKSEYYQKIWIGMKPGDYRYCMHASDRRKFVANAKELCEGGIDGIFVCMNDTHSNGRVNDRDGAAQGELIYDLACALGSGLKGVCGEEYFGKELADRFVLLFSPAGEDLESLKKFTELGNKPIDISLSVLFGNPPKMTRTVKRHDANLKPLNLEKIKLDQAVKRVLTLPTVGSKKFLITIGDRTVGGLSVRDQMVGPWQVPVSDVAVTMSGFGSQTGEAMALGERPPLAMINAPASGRMAVGEAITNIAAASIGKISDVKLSANWMAAAGFGNEDQRLFDTVKTVGEEFCPALGLTIPVGKDSLSMRTNWQEDGKDKSVVGPLSLIITSFAPVRNVGKTLTPQLQLDEASQLILIDLGQGNNRLGASALAQVYNQIGDETPDIQASTLKRFFAAIQKLNRQDQILAYHDRSDGGLMATLSEMAFASRCGLDINLKDLPGTPLGQLFNEELGAVIQVNAKHAQAVVRQLKKAIGPHIYGIGQSTRRQTITIKNGSNVAYKNTRQQLELWWSDTSFRIQSLRDNPTSARQEQLAIKNDHDPGLSAEFSFSPRLPIYHSRPKVAIFREQGVNGQVEMAAAFDRAGFTAVDVHLNDLLTERVSLDKFVGLAACGGFSYGDVLGAGGGWAKTILFHQKLRDEFQTFFERDKTFTLGVCNGCQTLSALKGLIPGADNWPRFLRNQSEQFEARLVMTKISESPSILFKGMAGSYMPVPVAHGEGRAEFDNNTQAKLALKTNLVPMQYVDSELRVTEHYPSNPNGSYMGITSLTTPDGRATIMMPHPERAWLTNQLSWHPSEWGRYSPWFKMFQNARAWVG